MSVVTLISAPTNLGLRPPEPGGVPGASKAPEALREAGLHRRLAELGAVDDGVVLPGRYVDGHTDFRHPGNSQECQSLAGEDLAAAVGRHWPAVADLEGRAPYVAPTDVIHLGCRDDDEHLAEVRGHLGGVLTAADVRRGGPASAADRVRSVVARPDVRGYWLHVDVDVLDPAYLSAVDSPSPGGLAPEELIDTLADLAPGALGAQVTVFDPDLDPDGSQAELLAQVIVDGLGALGSAGA